ncbi:hypothetical protein AaE_012595 [Aphanomyces astaci]|uniref:MULE transposase domain-containing protein n=2 Tax=Aphanomyces astaci TaxID=112090 RepID=A0A6A4ZBL1_APHAT|nr:hypothetical protein AaE_012595 [Aphanomyces astaci]
MWVFLATMDSARVDEFRATLPEYGITHKNVIKCNMDHDGPDLSLAKHHVMSVQYTRCVSRLCHPCGEDQTQPLRCPGSNRISTQIATVHRDSHHVGEFQQNDGNVVPRNPKVTLEMKNALATWIDDDPKHNSKTLFKMLKASKCQNRFGGMPCPTLKQVQHAVHYMRSKDHLQKSTVPAAIEELMKWRLTDNVEVQVAHKPFVFGVEEEGGRFELATVLCRHFVLVRISLVKVRTSHEVVVRLSTVELLRKYHAVVTAIPTKTVICHMNTTFSTNELGYPMFVFGYSDMAGSFHLLCVCITSQRTHADVAWLLRSLKEKFTSLLNYAWAPTRLMGD